MMQPQPIPLTTVHGWFVKSGRTPCPTVNDVRPLHALLHSPLATSMRLAVVRRDIEADAKRVAADLAKSKHPLPDKLRHD